MRHVRTAVLTTLITTVSSSLLGSGLVSRPALAGDRSNPAKAGENGWGDREPVNGTTHAVVLGDGTTMLFSVDGKKDKTIFEQRRSPEGVLGDRTVIATAKNGTYCAVTAVDVQQSTVGVGAQCFSKSDFEDPPKFALELTWTAGSEWSRVRHSKSVVNSVDVSPNAEHVAFATESEYFGTPQHVTAWSAAAGFVDHPRKERGVWGDSLVAGIGDDGRLAVLRTAGSEDEPGYWDGGRLSLLRLDPTTGRWVQGFSRAYDDQGVAGVDLDVDAQGAIFASYLRYRSISGPQQPDTSAWLLRKEPGSGVSRSKIAGLAPDVLDPRSGVTGDGVGFAAWQLSVGKKVVSEYTNWLPTKDRPHAVITFDRSGVTPGTRADAGLDLAVQATGHCVLAWVSANVERTTANAVSFDARETTFIAAGVSNWSVERRSTVQASAGSDGQSAAVIGQWRYYQPGRKASMVFGP